MTPAVTPLRSQSSTTTTNRVVSPELALVDPVLAAHERARLPEQPGSLRVRTGDASRSAGRALQALASAALEAHDLVGVPGEGTRRTWPRLAAVAVVSVLMLLLLDVRVDVGRTPAAADSAENAPAAVNRSPESRTDVPSGTDANTDGSAAPPKLQSPTRPTQKPVPRRFAWAPVGGADSYRVEFFRGDTRVFVATTKTPELTVPAQWALGGERRSLTAGEYRWYVWPITSGRRAQNAVVQATFAVP